MFSLEKLTFGYTEDELIFEDVTFSCEQQKIGVIGENGSGKTTLLKLLAQVENPNTGTIHYKGYPYISIYDFRNYGDFTIDEFLQLLKKLSSFTFVDFSQHLEGLSLNEHLDKTIKNLSQGTIKKLGLLCVFVSSRDILMIDEPFESVDEKSKLYIDKYLQEINKDLVIVDHDTEKLKSIVDVVININDLKIAKVENNHV